MPDADDIRITVSVTIPRSELVLKASRSSGPGGQHVNTSSSRIELVWNVAESTALDEETRAWLLKRLAPRLDGQGQLRLVAQEERSQLRNRDAAIERFAEVVARALARPKPRKRTRPPRAAKEARLETKKRRGAIKRNRRRPTDD